MGANKGQFSLLAIELFPDAEIFAFEPLAKAMRIKDKLESYGNVDKVLEPVVVVAVVGGLVALFFQNRP